MLLDHSGLAATIALFPMQDCTVFSSDIQLPFPCPADLFLSNQAEDTKGADFSYREASFLDNAKVGTTPLCIDMTLV